MEISNLTSQITNYKYAKTILRLSVFALLAAVIVLMFPRYNNAFRYHYEIGKPWGYNTLTADFDFPIYKTDDQLAKEQTQLLSTFAPIFNYIPRVQHEVKVVSLDPTRNIISDSLKYTLAEDVKVCVKATSIQEDNTKIEVTVPAEAETNPSEYEQRHFLLPGYTDAASLKEAAEKTLAEYKTDKMEGTLTLFGIPFVRKGDVVRLTDKDRSERDGKRFRVDAVTYSFGTGGYRQEVTLGKRVRS